jgi:hypothetical protein
LIKFLEENLRLETETVPGDYYEKDSTKICLKLRDQTISYVYVN